MLETSIKTDKLVSELNNRGYVCINTESFTSNVDLMMLILMHFKGESSIRYVTTDVHNMSNYDVHQIIHGAELVLYKHKDEDTNSREFSRILHQRNIGILEQCSKFSKLCIVGSSSDKLSDILMEDEIWLKLL